MTDVVAGLRWPFAPLHDVAGRPTAQVLAARVGVAPRTIWRWHQRGLTDHKVDHAAVALGYHPANIWTNWHNP